MPVPVSTIGTINPAIGDFLSSLLESGDYSDLTICCSGEMFAVHKAIICPQCPFFQKACSGHFSEAQSKTIPLPEDDAEVVRCMLAFLYCSDRAKIFPEDDVLMDTKLYAIADKYDIEALKAASISHAKEHTVFAEFCFLQRVELIYTSTLPCDRGLRDVVTKLAADSMPNIIDTEAEKPLREAVANIPEFGWDVMAQLAFQVAASKRERLLF